jgi:hypothetical protein
MSSNFYLVLLRLVENCGSRMRSDKLLGFLLSIIELWLVTPIITGDGPSICGPPLNLQVVLYS